MTVFDLSPELRWAFVFAHPDDELAVAAWMRRLSLAGVEVWSIWAHAPPHREAEARAAANGIGLAAERLTFLDFPDGGFADALPRLCSQVVEQLAALSPDRVVCAAFEQGHLDHDALNFAVRRAGVGTVLEFPEYWPYTPRVAAMNRFADPEGEEVLHLSPEEQTWKRVLAQGYPSQAIWRNLVAYEAWTAIKGSRAGLIKTERMRVAPPVDFRVPQVPAKYQSRVLASPQWRRWIAALDASGLG